MQPVPSDEALPVTDRREWKPGQRFADMPTGKPNWPGIWAHLGWEVIEIEPGYSVLQWEPDENHSFLAGDGWIVHGGMVTTLLDTAIGQATWSLLNNDEVFLTADLHTEFYRPTRPGIVRAVGRVTHKTKKVTFATAELFDANGTLLAGLRGTNITLEAPTND